MRRLFSCLALLFLVAADECGQPLTQEEAQWSFAESQVDSEASILASGSIELSTHFTLGGAVEQAAQELREYVASQLPCAALTLSGATLTIEYGKNPGTCLYRGQTYAGAHSISLKRVDAEVEIEHTWVGLRNQTVSVSGTATVTWDLQATSRRVVHRLTWTRLADGAQGEGTGDRRESALNGDLNQGIVVRGERTWTGKTGRWTLAIDDVQARWQDPVPQAGNYTLTTPFDGKSATLRFARENAMTIRVTVSSGRRSFDFRVTSAG